MKKLWVASIIALFMTLLSNFSSPQIKLNTSAFAVDPACTPISDTATVAGYTILSFTSTGTCSWDAPAGVTTLDSLLVVGGGGGGAGAFTSSNTDGAGAGGGGGVYSASSVSIPSTVTIQVGAGGSAGGYSANRNGNNGGQGSPSAFGTITAGGGGGGGCEINNATPGVNCSTPSTIGGNGTAAGSGGGTSNYYNAYNSGAAGTASSATFNGNVYTAQVGYNGSYYNQGGTSGTGAGGSGGGARSHASLNTPGNGFSSSIRGGAAVEYGKGGSAYGVLSWSFRSSTSGYGNGGDGQQGTSASGAAGAQGIVVVKYKNLPSNLFNVPSGNIFYRTSRIITATPNLAGKLTFKANNRIIAGCKNVTAIAYTPTPCNFKPSYRGSLALSVTLVPMDSSFATITTQLGTYFVYQRTGNR